MNKRILSILLCLMLVAALLVMAVPANAENNVNITVTASKTEAKPGDDVDITVTMGPIEALSTFDMKVLIPSGLTVVSADKNPDMTAAVGEGAYAVNAQKGNINGYTDSGNYSNTGDTLLAVFHCTVDDDATGTLTVTFDENEFWFTTEEDTENCIPYTSNTADVTIVSGSDETTAPTPDETTAPTPDETTAPTPDETTAPTPDETTAPTPDETTAPAECTHPNMQHVDEKPATTEETGLKEHYYCEDCCKYFADETGDNEVTYESLIIPKLTPDETTAPTPDETTAPTPDETTAPTPDETTAPTPDETTAPTPDETTAPTPDETTAPTPDETTAPTPDETTAPTPDETTPASDETVAPDETTASDETTAVEPTKAPATKDQSTKDSSTKDSSTKDSGTAKTGDSTHMYLWLLIMLASMAGVAVVLYTAKRKGIFTK